MADKQYGLSAQEVQALKEEAAMRLKNRETFLKEIHSPYRHAMQKGGHMFDPAIMRYHAMTESHLEFFRPTVKNSLWAGVFVFGCIGGFAMLLNWERESRFKKIRAGQVAYQDRPFKLI